MRERPRGLISIVAAAAALLAGQLAVGSAQAAQTITVTPATPAAENSFPFGEGGVSSWRPFMGFVYKNVPPFQLKQNDVLAFDLSFENDADDQLDIALAPTTANGNDTPGAAFTQVVSNTQLPANPRGNTTTGDYELQYRVDAPFNFSGGGLIIRFSNPGSQLAADTTGTGVLVNGGADSDTSGYFVERFVRDPDGSFPWTGDIYPNDIAAFRVELADTPASTTPTKKCKRHKKHHRAAIAKKKCKKKKRR